MRVARQNFILCALICGSTLLLLLPLYAYAQFNGINTAPSLNSNPKYPGPYADVTVSLNAYAMNTTGATISWYENGVELPEYKNERSIQVTTGELGSKTLIRAVIRPTSGAPSSVELLLNTSDIDIIIESDTSVPSFYKGRALPSSEAPVRIVAIPHTGRSTPLSSYTYTWEVGNKVLFGGPIFGKYAIEMNMPTYEGALLSVSVIDATGNTVAKRSTRLSYADPEVHFYEDNPLRGLSRKAIGEGFTLVGEEATIKAEPYYVNRDLAYTTGVYEWRLNTERIENPSDEPQAITLRKTGGSGSANVAFKMNNTKELFQFVAGSFNVFFE